VSGVGREPAVSAALREVLLLAAFLDDLFGEEHPVEPDRIEILRLEDGRLALRRYHLGLLQEATYMAEADLADHLAAWPGLPVLLHRSAAPLAEALRAAGRDVRGGAG
jgi:hypothetical protein